LQWIAPSFHRDRSPRWSPDGRSIAFVRTRAVGGTVDPVLIRKHQPWSIMVASLKDGAAQCVWTAPQTLEGSIPSWPGSFNLKWHPPQIVPFLSYHGGLTRLHAVQPDGSGFVQLTKGDFSVHQIAYSSNGCYIVFAANTGLEKEDQ